MDATIASAHVAAFQISASAALALPCCDLGMTLRMLPILWNLSRHRDKFHYADVRIMPKSRLRYRTAGGERTLGIGIIKATP
ncbi:hypothetical protein, partial [Caballeronia sp. INML2]|uniref:hypothetical protein n=1 Tax=Caballeronia sp. INML2 TaxID=2921748 RepID=UPI0020285E75